MDFEKDGSSGETQIHGLKICQEGSGSYSISVQHTGSFELRDYDEIEVEVKSTRLVRRR